MDPLRPGEVLDGKYEVRELLGAGAMGLVYQGFHRLLRKPVAIKALRPEVVGDEEIRRRFEAEARAAAALAHPNIVAVTDMGRAASGAIYFVMDRLDGESLGDRLLRVGQVPLDDIAPVIFGVIAGLEAAHEAGIVHRDLKPDNIFLTRAPGGAEIPKILDFGIAKAAAANERGHPGTVAGTVMGTPEYMAPEQARGEPDIDARADIYSLGVILYQMVAGRCPFRGGDPVAVLSALLAETPPSLHELRSGVPRALVNLIESTMARSRQHRPGSVREIRERLAAALSTKRAEPAAVVMPEAAALSLVGLDEVTHADRANRAHPEIALPGTVFAPSGIARAEGAGRVNLPPDEHFAPPADGPALELARPAPATEILPPPAVRSGRTRGVVVGAVVGGLLVALGIGLALRRPASPPAASPGAATGTRSILDPKARILVTFKVFPDDATLLIDGEPPRSNPAQLPQDGATHRLVGTRPGYATGAVDFVADRSRTVPLTLARAR